MHVSLQAYIDFEISQKQYELTRQLYDRLLDRTKHLKVWISYAKFEASLATRNEGDEYDLSEEKQVFSPEECLERARGN